MSPAVTPSVRLCELFKGQGVALRYSRRRSLERTASARASANSVFWGLITALPLAACGGGGGDSPAATPTYSVSGTVNGLATGGSVTLQNNGGDSVTVSAGSSFTFPTALVSGSAYSVTVSDQPRGQQCSVSSGSGSVGHSNVSSIVVNCVKLTYTVGGAVTGLSPGGNLSLLDNAGDALTVNGNGSFTFSTAIAYGESYAVTVDSQPADQTCTVGFGSGTVSAENVTNVQVSCIARTYTIGGTVTGLQPDRTLVLLDNGGDSVSVSANGTFTFMTGLSKGTSYTVTIGNEPSDQNCFIDKGSSGVVATSNVTDIVIHCPFVTTLFSFGPVIGGYGPETGLLLAGDGSLYGTTVSGGTNTVNTTNGDGAGIFFKLTSGQETVLWNFGAGQDGQNPSGDLVMDADGNFYGTAIIGGQYNGGIVFKLTAAGQETVLWNFGSGSDGKQPFGSLVLGQDGNLYGTTEEGGANGFGTVFRLTTAGVETVLWSFGAAGDGQTPKARLIQSSDGNLYGTTESGGTYGYGTVYRLTLTGTETVLYSFADGADGQGPEGVVEGSDGALYGITIGGGSSSTGTAFKVTKDGTETRLWTFGINSDGANPAVPPIFGSDGNLYGVTANGGVAGVGAVYQLTPGGRETVLWSFAVSDGETPFGTLTQGPDGALYGTTYLGGSGGGVVFKLTM